MNEVRLIDANALKEKFSELWNYEADYSIFKQTETLIDEVPTVEPDAIKELGSEILAIIKDILPQIVEQSSRIVRPSADWIEFKYGLYYCSNCFDKVDKDIDRIEHLVAKRDLSPFCPFCGSLMKGKGKTYD
jgi:hypothetical protein